MFHQLARELDEVPRHRGPGKAGISHVGQQGVERVAEFVEQGARLVERQQRRPLPSGRGEVGDGIDDRSNRTVHFLLHAQAAHPRPAMLLRPGEIVGE